LVNFPYPILKTAFSISAPSSTIVGHLPPSSRITGVRFSAAAFATNLPFSVLPVKQIKSKG